MIWRELCQHSLIPGNVYEERTFELRSEEQDLLRRACQAGELQQHRDLKATSGCWSTEDRRGEEPEMPHPFTKRSPGFSQESQGGFEGLRTERGSGMMALWVRQRCELVCCGGEMHSRELSMGSEGKRNQALDTVSPWVCFYDGEVWTKGKREHFGPLLCLRYLLSYREIPENNQEG